MENTYLFKLNRKVKGKKNLLWSARSLVEAKSEIAQLRGVSEKDIKEVWRKCE